MKCNGTIVIVAAFPLTRRLFLIVTKETKRTNSNSFFFTFSLDRKSNKKIKEKANAPQLFPGQRTTETPRLY
jgi:hypothetical protein